MVTITSKASRPEWQRAMARASEQYRLGVRARHLGGRRYEVPSATSNAVYVVEVINPTTLQATCTCAHASHAEAPHCWHICLSLCAAVERGSRKPKPTPQPAPLPRPTLPAAAELDAKVRRLFPNAA